MKAYRKFFKWKYFKFGTPFSLALITTFSAFNKNFQQLEPWAKKFVPNAIENIPVLSIPYVFIVLLICAVIVGRIGAWLEPTPTRYDDDRPSDDQPPI